MKWYPADGEEVNAGEKWRNFSCAPLGMVRDGEFMKRLSVGCGVWLLIGLGLGCGTGVAHGADSPLEIPELVRQLNETFVRVAETASRSVVVIRVAHRPSPSSLEFQDDSFLDMLPREFRQRFERDPGPGGGPPEFDGQGSGIIIRKEGFILTNRHVIDGAEAIKVRLADGREISAQVHGVDAQSDLAVLKMDPPEGLSVARLGDSSKTRVGEFAIAIGAPFELDYSVTFGHVSAKGRSYIIPDPTLDQDFIQTDATINPGNSGGPLVNLYGEVIGINTLIRGLRTGIGFAIPINLAREVADQLIETGRFARAWLGIGIRGLSHDPDYRALVKDLNEGVIVTEVLPNGPAAKSELKPTDVITAVDGVRVRTEQQLKNEVRSKRVGSDVTLSVHRSGRDLELKVRPEAWPEEDILAVRPQPVELEEPENTMGLTVRPVSEELAKEHRVVPVDGLIVIEVDPGSPAARKGIRAGDIITELDRKPVRTMTEFSKAMSKGNPRRGMIVNFISRGTSKFAILKD